ncbi:putative nuclease HARBI1 [Dreissena polymorpha]|uniref:putative nuclease HARBI1 n=1 Tax=Dreissena polymorpha TaxID=45954 RepID=UPI0022645867|nr:putative nuclease HARBI1 [Dreissena polymorpha]XP_052227483.1 putative nuclease HARBI1 [Dreissena polymorpha]
MADIHLVRRRRPRQFRRIDRQETDLTDDEVRRRYRFSSDNIDRLVRLLEPSLQRPTRRNKALTVRQQLLLTLRFLASGAFLQIIGDTFGVDIATVSRVVTNVTDCLFALKDTVIKFPLTDADRRRVMAGFFAMRGFPGVIGCVDCTHVRIISPGGEDEPSYVNRKGFHSLNVQATCDHKGMFTSINACWPGCCHDSHILRMSNIGQHLASHHQDPERGYLLGDSGYPCRPFLMTPFMQPVSDAQQRYNTAHIGTRNCIERAFGVWKRTFHVLHGEIRMKPTKVTRIVIACAVLHNLRLMWGEPPMDPEQLDDVPQGDMFQAANDGRRVRDTIVANYFM